MKHWIPLFLLASALPAQDRDALEKAVQPFIEAKQFMGTVLVARGGEVLLSKGYGSANLEWSIPNSPDTKFRLGSLTKQFTSASILLLEERGKLKVEDPIKKYLPDAPASWDNITIFHLLTHTSGIPNFTAFPEYEKFKLLATTPQELMALFRDKPLDFMPGEKMSYSNSGYEVLGRIIEKVSGESYADFLEKNIFARLGMASSGYDSNAKVIRHRASGYTPTGGLIENAAFIDMTVPYSAGALYSTTEDLFRWEHALFGGKLLTAASLKKMTTAYKDDYALGLECKAGTCSHDGGIDGFSTFMMHSSDPEIIVVVLANVNGPAPEKIGQALAALVTKR